MTWDDRYDREWVSDVDVGRTRIRYGLTTKSRVPVKFLVQLEYLIPGRWDGDTWIPGDWRIVARFDHDVDGPEYRNVDRVGLHLDIYDPNGIQRRKKTDFPPVELRQAMKRAEQYLTREHDSLVRRYERWM